MKTILYAWEIGDGFGHIRNLVAIAKALPQYRAAFAIPEHQGAAREYLSQAGYEEVYTFRPPPVVPLTRWLRPFSEYRASSFIDVLTCYAYDNITRFRGLYAQVAGVLDIADVGLVVAESAPTFLLAARGQVPTIATGTSYGTPQNVSQAASRYPQLDDRPLTPLMDEREMEAMLAQAFGKKINCMPLAAWFQADRIIPLCYPELDLYEEQRDLASIGVGPIAQFAPMDITSDKQFAYLSCNHPNIKRILEAIRSTSILTRVYVHGADFYHVAGPRLTVLKSFDLQEELAGCARVIHHGSAGLMQAALGAGRAQFVFPYHAENTQNVAKMWRLGNVNGCGYAESYRYHQSMVAGYGIELVGAQRMAQTLAVRKSPGVSAVAEHIVKFQETCHG